MGETKWTPGPWRLGLISDTTVQTLDGKIVAEVDGDYNQPELWPVMEANARLIAAAPDLYAALARCLNFLINHQSELGIAEGADDELESAKTARAALAKARGETP